METAKKIEVQSPAFKSVLSAAKKLSTEEKQLLRLQLFASDSIAEMKDFETELKKRKPLVKRTEKEIVRITTAIRKKNYANTNKMLHR